MRSPLIFVSKDTDIRACAKLMLDNDISSLIVEGEEINIFTKSDLVKLYAENYKGKYKIRDFMTKHVFTIYPSNSLHTALKILMKNRVSRVIVTRDNKIVGIITAKDLMPITTFVEGDKVQAMDEEDNGDKRTSNNLAAIGHVMIAKDIMKKPIIVEATDDLAKAAQIMTDKKISGLPVINSNIGDLVGVITKTDIVNALIESNA